ncbi:MULTISPECIES: hypothetical protein [Coprobacillaceae]|uniref:hypothetical protein n=1 Tax=Coprobacillaceae TaxID=2810280 RepID=UPI000E54C405|nr:MULTISPECIES: hypothetical protein [Coprobacillaceae]RHM62330.1 hypothetical protein DWZ53_02970 [Coprobacillus sp. AF33-1AC]RHS95730.1 hypothetical protein DW911_03130 [Erysipelatoclostridium sp. AM42-17]
MRLSLTKNEIELLNKFDIFIDENKDYSEDELLDLSESIYDQESFNYEKPIAKQLAHLGDKLQDLINE